MQNAVPYIPKEAFKNCTQLTEVVLPNGVTKICESAFENTAITNLDFLPSSVQVIESCAFKNSSLQSANLPNDALLTGDGAFQSCKNLTSANIYKGTNLPSFTFYNCEKLKEVTLNNGITEINKNAFRKTGIENLDFLTSNITVVDSSAFSESLLKSATLPKGAILTGDCVFKNCINLAYVNVQSGQTIPKETFKGCEKLTEVVLGDGIESIGESAFFNTAIKNVDFLPASLKHIEKSAFSSSGLTSVKLKDGVQMDMSVFSDCTSLKTVQLPSDLKVISTSLFSDCSSLSEVVLSAGLEEVQSRAFYKCAIKNLDFLPSTVKTIGTGAFSFCPIEEIRYPKALQSANRIFSAGLSVKTHILPVVLTKSAFAVQSENLYYEGTQDQFAERYPTNIGNGVDVGKIKIHFYIENKDDIDDPTKSYWHYAADGKIPVIWEL